MFDWRRLSAATLSVAVACYGVAYLDANLANGYELKPPSFITYNEQPDSHEAIVAGDGFIGDSWERSQGILRAFGNKQTIFVRYHGPKFNLEYNALEVANELRRRGITRVTLMGISLGAKLAYRLAQIVQQQNIATVKGLVLVDGLYSGDGVKNPFAGVLAGWQAGPIQNTLFSKPMGIALTNSWTGAKNSHQQFGRDLALSLAADQARASLDDPIPGELNGAGIKAVILHCPLSLDTVLWGSQEAAAWHDRLTKDGVDMVVTKEVLGTGHAELDKHPTVWVGPIAEALTLVA